MGVFRDLQRTPGVFRILISQLTAKFPIGMLSIVIMLHVEKIYGDYTSAGLILAFASVGQGIAGPLTSRWMGHWGMRPVLILTSTVSASAMTAIALLSVPLMVIAVLALIMGLTTPPVTSSVRTIYPKLVPGRQIAPLFSLDAALQEVIWIVGPVLAVFLSATISTEVGLLTAVGFMILGGAWFITAPELGKVRIPKSRRRLGAVLTRPTVLISTLIGFFFIASFAALEISIVSIFGHDGVESGIVLAFFALGSLVGGVTIGRREPSSWSLALRSTGILAGISLTLFSPNIWWLSFVLFLGGIGTAPMFSALFTMVSSTVKFSETAESYGWLQTGHLIGAAIGSALAGVAIDAFESNGGIVISILFLLVTVFLSVITSRWIPDLRGRDASPIPDTDPIMMPETL
ncbi:MAG TPA: MFS transporter [Microbacteriaceae bacterium]|nr:MFS transporter [Microbacteriaceae bacterium]